MEHLHKLTINGMFTSGDEVSRVAIIESDERRLHPPKSSRKVHPTINSYVYYLKNRIKRRLSKPEHSGRQASRYDKTRRAPSG